MTQVDVSVFSNMLKKSLELQGFAFRLTNFGNRMEARYKRSGAIFQCVDVTNDSLRMRARLYEDCLEFLESRAKVKGE